MSIENLPVVIVEDEFRDRSLARLTLPEHNVLVAYMEKGGHPLAPEVAANFFQLFLNGMTTTEIHRLNKAFPHEAILWARVKYKWDEERDDYTRTLTESVKQQVMKASLETTSLISNMLVAANKKHGDKIKRYIQTGNVEDLGDSMSVDNLTSLIRAVEALQKITGQDKVQKIDKRETLDVNVNVTAGASEIGEGTRKMILGAIANEKREKLRGKDESGTEGSNSPKS